MSSPMSAVKAKLTASRELMITVTMDEETARKMGAAIQRLLSAVDHLEPGARNHLVNTGTIDAALAMRMSIEGQLP